MKTDRQGPSASFVKRLLFETGRTSAEAIARGIPRDEVLEGMSQSLLKGLGKNTLGPFPAIAPSFALAWAESGFPTIEPSHRLAASLMATSVPEDHVDEFVRMPWRCFAFHIPEGLVARGDGFGLALHARDGVFKTMDIHGGALHIGFEPTLAGWISKIGPQQNDKTELTVEETDQQARLMELTGRLLLGICLEMSAYRPSEGNASSSGTIQRATKEGIYPSVFKLTRDVKVDARKAVREYAAGQRRVNPTVRVLVRGHWKLQAHGPGRTERSPIHIEPYWRGEETAPVAVRSHVLDKEQQV
jgi:hypothetical protein